MCDLSRAEQGSLTSLLGDLQAAEARLSATYPEIFTRAWADHEAMLAALDDLTAAATSFAACPLLPAPQSAQAVLPSRQSRRRLWRPRRGSRDR